MHVVLLTRHFVSRETHKPILDIDDIYFWMWKGQKLITIRIPIQLQILS